MPTFIKQGSNLFIQVKCTSAVMQNFMTNKTYSHSEYDTNWSNQCSDWASKGYCRHIIVTKYVGTEHVIFEIEFVFPKFDEEFIKEINEYFNPDKYVSEYISYVTYDKTEKFIS